ncbi:MAG: ASKHA domain-containing protein [Bacillota bacterium]
MKRIYIGHSSLWIDAPEGQTLLAALAGAMDVPADCGGKGTCGKCKVLVRGINKRPTPAEKRFLTREELEAGIRLACEVRIESDLAVEAGENDWSRGKVALHGGDFHLAPGVRRIPLSLPGPKLEDARSDRERLCGALRDEGYELASSLGINRDISDLLRKNDFNCRAICYDGICSAVAEPGEGHCLGVAIDLGTTSIVGLLYDLETGARLGLSSRNNPQAAYGADVVSRLEYVIQNPDGLQRLQRAATDAVNSMIRELCAGAGADARDILEVVAVGNTVMQHFLCGINPRGLATLPFVAVDHSGINVQAGELGLDIPPYARVYLPPGIGGFIGSDTTAVILATRLHELPASENALAVDLGTNGEIVLASGGSLFACATAAGPAFEGARLSIGMRGAVGAIEAVEIGEAGIQVSAIGGGEPRGICGSGAVDLLAELLKHGVIGSNGGFLARDSMNRKDLAERVIELPEGPGFFISRRREADSAGLCLTQKDIRELQLAKAAIAAAIKILLQERNLSAEQLDRLYLAGAFGNYINPENALRIGLLPPIDPFKIVPVGNAAGTGAVQMLLDSGLRRKMEETAARIRAVELAVKLEFQDAFVDGMLFPEPASPR